MLPGNLVLHYKEKHPGNKVPESLMTVMAEGELHKSDNILDETDSLLDSIPMEKYEQAAGAGDMEVRHTECQVIEW